MVRLTLLSSFLPVIVAGDWVLTFEDDFVGTSLNTTVWLVRDNFTHGSQEWQLYVADEVSVADSNLLIHTSARHANYGEKPYNYTSGWVSSNWGQAEGRFEARIKLPQPARYVWPAFWLLPQSNPDGRHSTEPTVSRCWPTGGEIDILESVGQYKNDSVFLTYHWGTQCGVDEWDKVNGACPPDYETHPIDFSADYHLFAVEFNTSVLTWFVDGAPYYSRTAGEPASLFLPSWPMSVILNTAMSFWAPDKLTPNPADFPKEGVVMAVDWVRTYAWKA